MQDVTIGSVRGETVNLQIGDNVVLSSGCKIINSTIGDNVIIGSNAVVVKDIEANAVAVGIPAKVISHNGLQHVTYYY